MVGSEKQLAFRVPETLVARIDAYAEFMREQNPGLAATRSDAVRMLLLQALMAHEELNPTRKGKRR